MGWCSHLCVLPALARRLVPLPRLSDLSAAGAGWRWRSQIHPTPCCSCGEQIPWPLGKVGPLKVKILMLPIPLEGKGDAIRTFMVVKALKFGPSYEGELLAFSHAYRSTLLCWARYLRFDCSELLAWATLINSAALKSPSKDFFQSTTSQTYGISNPSKENVRWSTWVGTCWSSAFLRCINRWQQAVPPGATSKAAAAAAGDDLPLCWQWSEV